MLAWARCLAPEPSVAPELEMRPLARVAAVSPSVFPLAEVASDADQRARANVTLTCPGGGPEDNATVHWVLRSQMTGSHPGTPLAGRRLLLPSVQPSDPETIHAGRGRPPSWESALGGGR